MALQSTDKKILNFYYPPDFIQAIPSLITSIRLVILPHLALTINQDITIISYVLFLFAIGTDFVDGWIARKLGITSKFGAYFDTSVDFIFILGLFGVFVNSGIYSNWLLSIILLMYLQFVLSNLYLKHTIYDPIGKYYGSILFAGIGLTILFPGQLTYVVVTYGIVISTLASIIGRLIFFISQRGKLNRRTDEL
jgi:phosphatidylglycerophosphate synthase